MAIVFARPFLRRGRVPARALVQQLKATAPARPSQAAVIKRPVKPFITGYVPPVVRPRPRPEVEAFVPGQPFPPTPAVEPVAESVVIAAPPPAPKTCAECGAKAPAPVAAAPAPSVSASLAPSVVAAEITGADLRVVATAPDEVPVPTRKPKVGIGLLIGLGVVVVLLAYASTVRPR